jgi:DNA-binding MarR family transcriptional regulator
MHIDPLSSVLRTMTLEKEIHQVKPFRNAYHKAYVNLIYTGKWIMQFTSDLLKPYDVTSQQYNILRILRGRYPEATTVLFIRERMLDRMSDASRIVELLRKKEMIERNVCTDNRRKMNVVITHKGLRLLETIEKENDKMDMRLYSLNEQEINQLNYLLDKLRNP